MTKEEVKDKMWEVFEYWMRGQTVALAKDGSVIYYDWDVNRFLDGMNRLADRLPEFG